MFSSIKSTREGRDIRGRDFDTGMGPGHHLLGERNDTLILCDFCLLGWSQGGEKRIWRVHGVGVALGVVVIDLWCGLIGN